MYQWKLDDEEFTKTTKTLFQVYSDPGVYNVQVTASNRNNTVRSSGIIVAQDEIKGFECVRNTAAVVPMEEIVIEWIISQGSSLFLHVHVVLAQVTILHGSGCFSAVKSNCSEWYTETSSSCLEISCDKDRYICFNCIC